MRASNVSSNQGARASAREDSIASCGVSRSGCTRNCPNASLRSDAEPLIASSNGSSRRSARNAVISDPRWNRASPGVWKPAGDSAVADATTPRLASSSAIQPPSELPATWARPTPRPSMNSLDRRTSESIPAGVPGGGRGEAAKPGRSKAMTSRSGASCLNTGSPHLPAAPDPMDEDERLARPDAMVVQLRG